MNMSFFEKVQIIFDYMFSSFLSIGILLVTLFLLCILFINLKVNNKYINFLAIGVYLGLVLGIIISYSDYVRLCIDSLVKKILNYVYFPSTFVYFLIFCFVTGLMIYTIFSKKMGKIKKTINYICFSILYFLFMSFIVCTIRNGSDIYDIISLYKNQLILSIVQISNLLFLLWLLFTCFYNLYIFFRKKYG